jgi:hypothetical protein
MLVPSVIVGAIGIGAALSLPVDSIPELVQTDLALELRVDYEAGTVGGTATLVLRNAGQDPIPVIPLQIGRLMSVTGVEGADGRQIPFHQDVVQYADWPAFQVNQISIDLPQALSAGETQTISVHYGGVLVGYAETGMQYVRDRVNREFTILRTDALAFPSIGVPSIAGLRALPRADFGFSARITVPSDLTVAAAVRPDSLDRENGETTWVFRGDQPVPFVNIAIAPYETMDAAGVRIFHFADDTEGAGRLSARLHETISQYGSWFGTGKPDGTVTIIEIPEGWGSQASLAGGIIQTADAFRDMSAMSQLYHEIAHLWHPMDTDVPSIRWNEGLATFMAMRLDAQFDPDIDLASSMEALAERQRARQASNPVPMAEFGGRNLTDLSYGTGALMFYMLYESLGPKELDAALGSYIREYRETGSSTEEFVIALKEAGPSVVSAVLNDWLYTASWLDRMESGESVADLIESYQGQR